MSKYWDRNGLPLQATYKDFFFGTYGGGTLRNAIAKKEAKRLWAEKDAKDAKDAQAVKDAAAAAAKAAEEAKKAEDAKKAEKAKAAEEAAKWTDIEDKALLNMKAQGISWKDIGIIMGGKDKDVVKARYKELMAAKDKEDAVAGKSESSKEKESKGKKGKEGKKDKEGKRDKEGKSHEGEGKEPKEKELKSILKKSAKDKKHQESKKQEEKSTAGRPIVNITIEEDDELSKDDLAYIFRVNEHCNRKKWVEMASKLFDKTGKRVSPDLLERKLKAIANL